MQEGYFFNHTHTNETIVQTIAAAASAEVEWQEFEAEVG